MSLVVITDGEHLVADPAVADEVAAVVDDVRLVLWTSRSYQQTAVVRRRWSVAIPAFVENGSALCMPEGAVTRRALWMCGVGDRRLIEFGCPREVAAAALFRAVCDGVVALDHASVDRHYDQPFRFLDPSPAARLTVRRAIRVLELGWTRSSCNEHVNGVVDARVGLCLLRELVEQAVDQPAVVVGFGQTRNHLPVLLEADVPIIIRHSDAAVTRWLARRVRRARIIDDSPQAWADTVCEYATMRRHSPTPTAHAPVRCH